MSKGLQEQTLALAQGLEVAFPLLLQLQEMVHRPGQAVRQVTAEQLVGAVTGQGHLDMAVNEDAQKKGGDGAGERLVKGREDMGQFGGEFPGGEDIFVVRGVEALRHQPGEMNVQGFAGKLAGGLFVVAQAEGGHRLGLVAAHQGHHRAGIHPSREVGAVGGVALHAQSHGVVQQSEQVPGGLLGGDVGDGLAEIQAPVRVHLDVAVFPNEVVPGEQLLDVLKGGGRGAEVFQAEIMIQGRKVELPGNPVMRQDGLDLGAEDQVPADLAPVQGLFADAVPVEQQAAALPVPQGQPEHAVSLGLVGPEVAVFLVGVDDGLGVAVVGAEVVARA